MSYHFLIFFFALQAIVSALRPCPINFFWSEKIGECISNTAQSTTYPACTITVQVQNANVQYCTETIGDPLVFTGVLCDDDVNIRWEYVDPSSCRTRASESASNVPTYWGYCGTAPTNNVSPWPLTIYDGVTQSSNCPGTRQASDTSAYPQSCVVEDFLDSAGVFVSLTLAGTNGGICLEPGEPRVPRVDPLVIEIVLDSLSSLISTNGNGLRVFGRITGTGHLKLDHQIATNYNEVLSLVIGGGFNNDYSGHTWIVNGEVALKKGITVTAVPTHFTVLPDSRLVSYQSHQIVDSAEAIVFGEWELLCYAERISQLTLHGGTNSIAANQIIYGEHLTGTSLTTMTLVSAEAGRDAECSDNCMADTDCSFWTRAVSSTSCELFQPTTPISKDTDAGWNSGIFRVPDNTGGVLSMHGSILVVDAVNYQNSLVTTPGLYHPTDFSGQGNGLIFVLGTTATQLTVDYQKSGSWPKVFYATADLQGGFGPDCLSGCELDSYIDTRNFNVLFTYQTIFTGMIVGKGSITIQSAHFEFQTQPNLHEGGTKVECSGTCLIYLSGLNAFDGYHPTIPGYFEASAGTEVYTSYSYQFSYLSDLVFDANAKLFLQDHIEIINSLTIQNYGSQVMFDMGTTGTAKLYIRYFYVDGALTVADGKYTAGDLAMFTGTGTIIIDSTGTFDGRNCFIRGAPDNEATRQRKVIGPYGGVHLYKGSYTETTEIEVMATDSIFTFDSAGYTYNFNGAINGLGAVIYADSDGGGAVVTLSTPSQLAGLTIVTCPVQFTASSATPITNGDIKNYNDLTIEAAFAMPVDKSILNMVAESVLTLAASQIFLSLVLQVPPPGFGIVLQTNPTITTQLTVGSFNYHGVFTQDNLAFVSGPGTISDCSDPLNCLQVTCLPVSDPDASIASNNCSEPSNPGDYCVETCADGYYARGGSGSRTCIYGVGQYDNATLVCDPIKWVRYVNISSVYGHVTPSTSNSWATYLGTYPNYDYCQDVVTNTYHTNGAFYSWTWINERGAYYLQCFGVKVTNWINVKRPSVISGRIISLVAPTPAPTPGPPTLSCMYAQCAQLNRVACVDSYHKGFCGNCILPYKGVVGPSLLPCQLLAVGQPITCESCQSNILFDIDKPCNTYTTLQTTVPQILGQATGIVAKRVKVISVDSCTDPNTTTTRRRLLSSSGTRRGGSMGLTVEILPDSDNTEDSPRGAFGTINLQSLDSKSFLRNLPASLHLQIGTQQDIVENITATIQELCSDAVFRAQGKCPTTIGFPTATSFTTIQTFPLGFPGLGKIIVKSIFDKTKPLTVRLQNRLNGSPFNGKAPIVTAVFNFWDDTGKLLNPTPIHSVNGVATLTFTPDPSTRRKYLVYCFGDQNYLPSYTPTKLFATIIKAQSTSALLPPNPKKPNRMTLQSTPKKFITISCQVTGVSATKIPTGTVTYFSGNKKLNKTPIALVRGQAKWRGKLPLGIHKIKVQYNGSANYKGSNSRKILTVTVKKGPA